MAIDYSSGTNVPVGTKMEHVAEYFSSKPTRITGSSLSGEIMPNLVADGKAAADAQQNTQTYGLT